MPWSQHWCPICVHYQFSCAFKLARKYKIELWSWSSQAINWSADSFQKNTSRRWVDTWACDMVIWYWSVAILFWQLPIDHFVNAQIQDVDLPRHAWNTPPSLLTVSPTLPLQSVDAYVRTYVCSVNHATTKRKEVDHIPWDMGLCTYKQKQELIKWSLHLPYMPLEPTLSRVDL